VLDYVGSSDDSQSTCSLQDSIVSTTTSGYSSRPDLPYSPRPPSNRSPIIDEDYDTDKFWRSLSHSSNNNSLYNLLSISPSPPASPAHSDREEESSINPFPSTIPQLKATCQQQHTSCPTQKGHIKVHIYCDIPIIIIVKKTTEDACLRTKQVLIYSLKIMGFYMGLDNGVITILTYFEGFVTYN